MGLKLLKAPDGNLRPTWYADFRKDGRTVRRNLGVPIRGKPRLNADGNPTIHGGDRDFEASRREAEAKMKRIRDEAKKDAVQLIREAYRLRTGAALEDVRLDELAAKWRDIPRDPPATPEQLARADRIFADFAAFASTYTPPPSSKKRQRRPTHPERIATLNAVTPDLALAYFQHSREALAWATAASRKHLLSSAWKTFATTGGANPFKSIVTKRDRNDPAARTVHRSLLDERQLERLFELAEPAPFLYPLVVCAASTGLRLGDVCNLRWASVSFHEGRPDKLKVATSKTGAEVVIPVFPRFAAVLERRLAERETEEGRGGKWDPLVYVFPTAARGYSSEGSQTAIVRAVKPLFARAVFGDQPEPPAEDAEPLDPATVETAIAAAPWKDAKRERILDLWRRFARGDSYGAIRKATGRSSPLISQDLHAVEILIGRPVRPGVNPAGDASLNAMRERTRLRLPGRHRASSIYGWHSLRGSAATLMFEYGVPLEAVAAIVGHATAKMTWDNYMAKDRIAEQARKALAGSVLGDSSAPVALPAPTPAAVPVVAPSVVDHALALRYVCKSVLDADQRRRLADAANALAVADDNHAERFALAVRIMTKDQRNRALDGLRALALA